MATFEETAEIKKYIRSINFLKSSPPVGGDTPAGSTNDDDADSNSITISCQSNSDSVKVDSVRSCESVLKIFTFETNVFNKNNEKCLDFWNTIKSRDDIQPVNCTIMDAQNNKRTSECQTEQKESEASLWARALYELRRRKLDKVALVTTTETCKFCKAINCRHISSAIDPKELIDDMDLTELDNWSPRTSNKNTQFSFKDVARDIGTSVQSGLDKNILNDLSSSSDSVIKHLQDEKLVSVSELQESSCELLPVQGGESSSKMDGDAVDENIASGMQAVKLSYGTIDTIGSDCIVPQKDTDDADKKTHSSKSTESPKSGGSYEAQTERKRVSLLLGSPKQEFKTSSPKTSSMRIAQQTEVQKQMSRTESKSISFGESLISTKHLSSLDTIVASKLSAKRETTPSPEKLLSRRSSLKSPSNFSASIRQTPSKDMKREKSDEKKPFKKSSKELQEPEQQQTVKSAKGPPEEDENSHPRVSPSQKSTSLTSEASKTSGTMLEVTRRSSLKSSPKEKNSLLMHRTSRSLSKASDSITRKQISFGGRGQKRSPLTKPKVGSAAVTKTLSDMMQKKSAMGTSYSHLINQETEYFAESTPNLIDTNLSQELNTTSTEKLSITRGQGSKGSKSGSLSVVKLSKDAAINSQTSKSMMEQEEEITFRDQLTETPHLTSLLHMDTLQRLEAISERKKKIEDELRKVQIPDEGQEIDPKIYLCPCLSTMQKSTCFECTCKQGICKTPDESGLDRIEQLFNHMPPTERRKMKCVMKILHQIKKIMALNLDQKSTDDKIVKVLTSLEPCECEDGPCECKIHHLNVDEMRDNEDFMTAIILDQFNKVLDERLESKLGVHLVKKPRIKNKSTEAIEVFSPTTTVHEKIPCNMCKFKPCVCRKQ